MKKIFYNRYGSIWILYFIFVGLAVLSRTVLLFKSFSEIDKSFFELFKIYSVGFFFDTVTFVYFALFFVFLISVLPDKWNNSVTNKLTQSVLYFVAIVILIFNVVSEYFFWDEFGVRYNFIAVDYLVYTNEVIGNINESYPLPVLFTAIGIVAIAISFFSFGSVIYKSSFFSVSEIKARIFVFFSFLMVAIICALGVSDRMSRISGNQYHVELARNGIYSFFSAFRSNELDYYKFYKTLPDDEVFGDIKQEIRIPNDSILNQNKKDIWRYTKSVNPEQKYNVIFVLVESLSGEYMSYIGNKRGITTPFLDSIVDNSLFFSNLYATGTRTVRGIEAVTLSYPPTPGLSIVKRPDNQNLFNIGSVFKEKGYQNRFIYGGFGYFDNMNAFFENCGFDIVDRSSLEKNEITFANVWGVCDQDLYNRAIKEADLSFESGKPFFSFILTTSNHRPYTFPDLGIDFPMSREGGVKYTDYALRDFFKKASGKEWFKNTIFVVVADHCGGSAGRAELPIREYQIPFIVYNPAIVAPRKVDVLCSQIDVAPTLLDIMGWSYKNSFFGKSILKMDPTAGRAFIGNYQKLGFLTDSVLTMLGPRSEVSQFVYNRWSGDTKPSGYLPQMVKASIGYYQSASFVFKNGVSKIHE